MTRRCLIGCGALVISTTLVAVAWSEAPSSLAEQIGKLRRSWSGSGSSQATSQSATAPATPGTTTPPTARRGVLPKVDPRSLLPDNLFSRSTTGAATQDNRAKSAPSRSTAARTVPTAAMAAGTRVASRQPTTSAPASRTPADGVVLPGLGTSPAAVSRASGTPTGIPTSAHTPAVSNARSTVPPSNSASARRSPEHRAPVNFNSDALRNELAGAFPAPDNAEPTTSAEPTVADDFAAGLEKEAAALGRSVSSKSSATGAEAGNAGPIAVQPSAASSRAGQVAAGSERYQQPAFPTVGGLLGRKDAVKFAPDSDGEAVVITDKAAAEAFGANSPSRPATQLRSAQVSPFVTRDAAPDRSTALGRESFSESEPTPLAASAVLVTNQAPAITFDIRGPQQITIGREATYQVRLQNTGASAAEDLVATVRIPSWAEVVTTTVTQGNVRQVDGSEPSGAIQWQIPRLEAQAEETLSLELIPRASRPLELGVTWTHAPVDARTVVEVQEPKLRMQVSGPDEVLFGKPHVYRLTLSNPGTGTAENVRIDLLPPGGGHESISTHSIGNLPPGASKAVEVELTAREAGKLSVQAVAKADGGLVSEATKELFCRKPALGVDWRGPEMQYAGTPATYFFRVRNPGTAAADDVAVRVTLPSGAEFVSASEGYMHNADEGEIAWRVGSLGPGDDCYMELRCIVHTPGDNQLRVLAATAAGDLTDDKLAVTKVVALADLTLDVSDPTGPVPVGEEALYEIRVTNRGASAADDVNVVGLFSAGLEPETVDGTPYTATDGRVSFRTIRKLPAGQNVVLQIRARATQPGTHVFRAEVLCRDLEIKLAAEETTRFYENQVVHEPPAATPTTIGSGAAGLTR